MSGFDLNLSLNFHHRNGYTLLSDRKDMPIFVTGYRLLVSTVFVSFCLVKMTCGYRGFSSAMNTLDWIISIPLTLG